MWTSASTYRLAPRWRKLIRRILPRRWPANAANRGGQSGGCYDNVSRSKELLAHGAAAHKDVEAAEAAYLAALAERDRAEAVLANYGGTDKSTNELYLFRARSPERWWTKTSIRARNCAPDLMLANVPQTFNCTCFIVSDPTKLWLQVDVAESDLLVAANRAKAVRSTLTRLSRQGLLTAAWIGLGTRWIRTPALSRSAGLWSTPTNCSRRRCT